MTSKFYLTCETEIDVSGASPVCNDGWQSYTYNPTEFDPFNDLDTLQAGQLFGVGFGITFSFLLIAFFIMGVVGMFRHNSRSN